MARRIVIDDHRMRRERPDEVADEALQYRAPPDEIDLVIDSVVVLDAMRTLTPAHREALTLVYYAGHSIQEAANILGLLTGAPSGRPWIRPCRRRARAVPAAAASNRR